ncbi:carbohydrate ABC transporter permease [Caldalkalibacillus thermarum TA2.A1]|uniref:Carbohydrate ABC transporter permease n=3 Tax=Caldalkalibacillus TaxID=379065 RepID=A0A8X8LBX6_CALTT|nr:carbohydrate ABC transporter permease [Caldalkalibacillus thermarum TA2.A1]
MKTSQKILTHTLLIMASIIALFPMIWILSTSFKPREDVFSRELRIIPENFTWDNYIYVLTFKDGIFLKWVMNSVFVAGATTLVALFLASTAAYAFSRFKFPGRRAGLFSFLVTQMFPGALLIVPLYTILRDYGLINTYGGLILSYSTVALPFCVWMLKGFFDTIPVELEEAARIDGLNSFGTFYRIVLPLALPGLAVTAFFSFITAWNEFMFALTFMNSEEKFTLPVGLRTFVYQFNTDWHWLSAGSIMITIPVLIVFAIASKWIISGLTTGGVKG